MSVSGQVAMAPYLALDVIRPGDIVLSAGWTKTSIGIRVATFSRVSHAALALHPLIWFEALGSSGVVYKVVEPELVWDGEKVRLAMRLARGETYTVKRLKNAPYCTADAVARHAFARSLIQATSRFAFLNYATPDRFLPLLKFKLGRAKFVNFIANNLNRSRTALYPGPFCSWLVADCYNDVGLSLFDMDSDRISPRALDRSEKLCQITSPISAKPLDIASHFKPFERQLRLAVALSSRNLSSLFEGASLAKAVTEINACIVALGKRGARLLGEKALEDAADSLGEIDERSKSDFEFWQNRTQAALDLAYPNLASSSERVDLLTFCQKECSDKRPGGLSCSDLRGCHKLTMGTLHTREALYNVFPRPSPPSEADWS